MQGQRTQEFGGGPGSFSVAEVDAVDETKSSNRATVVTFRPEFRDAFRELNLAWIQQYFKIEAKDLEQVNEPEACIRDGGQIFFVVENGRAVGTCAMYRVDEPAVAGDGPAGKHAGDRDKIFELAKMAVDPAFQGRGFGDALMHRCESWARERGARKILILSNTILGPAIRLYQRHGYQTIHLGPHPDYERANIEMHKDL